MNLTERQQQSVELILKEEVDQMGEEEQRMLKRVFDTPDPVTTQTLFKGENMKGENASLWMGTMTKLVQNGILVRDRVKNYRPLEFTYVLNPAVREAVVKARG